MTTYLFFCPECHHRLELDFPMDDVEGRRKAACPVCGGPIQQTFDTVQFRMLPWWGEHTHYDVLPPEVKGAGPASKEFRDFATRTRGARERWL